MKWKRSVFVALPVLFLLGAASEPVTVTEENVQTFYRSYARVTERPLEVSAWLSALCVSPSPEHYEQEEERAGPHARAFAHVYVLPALFAELGVRSVVALRRFQLVPGLEVDLDSYLGIEVVEGLAQLNETRHGSMGRHFTSLDIIRDPLPRVDLIFCRDCLVHLKNRQALGALRNFRRSRSTYLLATTFTRRDPNRDAPLGGWRPLNLELAPFDLGPPLRLISEADSVEDPSFTDKSLGLWRL